MDLKEKVLSDEENGESILSTSQYSDDDSTLPFSTDSEDEKDYLKSLEQKNIPSSKFTCIERKYLKFNPGSKELMIERSLQDRKIVKIGEVWFSHPMYDDRSSPEDSSSDDERSVNNKNISYKQNHCESLSNIMDLIVGTSEESEQFDELYQAKEAMEIDSKSSWNIVKTSDEESDQIDELHQEIEGSNSNSFKKEFLNNRERLLI
ncbi:unnamed protein product [Rhizophagus irregularis]|nr:unnamed protein product [Rhizophagus irregularis]